MSQLETIEWIDMREALPPAGPALLIDVAPSPSNPQDEEADVCVAYFLPDEGDDLGAAFITLEGTALAIEGVVYWAYGPGGPRRVVCADLERPVGFHQAEALTWQS